TGFRMNVMPAPSSKLMQNLGVMVQLACIWEATARKPGNVHRFADFDALHYVDFLASAAAIGGVLDKAWFRPVGEIVLEAIMATHVAFLAAFRDSLIERKHGREVANEVRTEASRSGSDPAKLDAWLRSRHLNPGTSADLTAASLFAALREGIIPLPYPGKWS